MMRDQCIEQYDKLPGKRIDIADRAYRNNLFKHWNITVDVTKSYQGQ